MKRDIKLSALPKHNIYQVPEGYFERLPMRVMEHTAGADAKQNAWQQRLPAPLRLALAPLVLLLVFAGVFSLNTPSQPQPEAYALSSVAQTEIVDYLANQVRLETSDFADLALAEEKLTADFMNISPKKAAQELEHYTLDDIEL